MADFYCDPSLPISGSYNATPVAGGTVPTKPDEGDGKALGVAVKASGTITIGTNLNAADTISFNGKTFTAGTDFTIGASAAATATNIAAAINALSATTAWTVGNGYQFRDLFNACVASNVVTVHTRIGSADWNAVAITTSSGGRATVVSFSGGVSGAFGWAINTAALVWPSGTKAAATYGVLVSEPVGYVIANGSKIHVRCGNGTTGVTLACGNSAPMFKKRGTTVLPVVFKFDDGTVWTADSGDNAQLAISYELTSEYSLAEWGFNFTASSETDANLVFDGKQYANGTRNFKLHNRPSGGSLPYSSGTAMCLYCGVTLNNIEIVDGTSTYNNGERTQSYSLWGYNGRVAVLNNVKISHAIGWKDSRFIRTVGYASSGIVMNGGEIAIGSMSSPDSRPLLYVDPVAYNVIASFRGVRFSGITPNSLFSEVGPNSGRRRSVELIDCEGVHNFNFLNATSIVRIGASTNSNHASFLVSGIKGNGYVLDTPEYQAAWLPSLGFPYLNGLVEENQPASIRVEYSINAANVSQSMPATLFDTLVFNESDSAVAKTLTTQVAIDENLTLNTAVFVMNVSYTDSATGIVSVITSLVNQLDAVALTDSTETWYPEDGGRPYYTEGTAKYYNKKKLTITTPTMVKANSMMRVWLTINTANTGTGRYIFIDPYIQVV